MSWVKLDDQLHGNRKIKRAWKTRGALGLHLLALSYSGCYDLEGFVPEDFVEEKLPSARERSAAVNALTFVPAGCQAGLWIAVDGGWRIHDWEQYNGDSKTREAMRAAKSAAGKKGAEARWGPKQSHDTAMAPAIAPANGTAMAPSPSPSHTATASSGEPDIDAAKDRLKSGVEQRVFDAWIEATGKTGATVLTEKRRRLIRNALRLYSLDDVLDAVAGWRRSPHHRGENPSGTIYNDLELLLRDAEHIEKFRDLNREAAGQRGDQPATIAELQAAQQRRSAA